MRKHMNIITKTEDGHWCSFLTLFNLRGIQKWHYHFPMAHVGLQRANQSYHATEALAASASQAVCNAGCHRTSSPSVGKWHMRKRGTQAGLEIARWVVVVVEIV